MNKKELVASHLKKHPEGLTIVDIARALNLSRNTISVALAELLGANLIWIRPVGVAKLHYWKGSKR